MKELISIFVSLILADLIVCACCISLLNSGDIESVAFLLIPIIILVPFHWLAILSLKEEIRNRKK
jgi:hypothetical protein